MYLSGHFFTCYPEHGAVGRVQLQDAEGHVVVLPVLGEPVLPVRHARVGHPPLPSMHTPPGRHRPAAKRREAQMHQPALFNITQNTL